MIDTRFLSVFLSGIATAYFALSAYFLFRRKESSRLQIVVGCIFLQWTVSGFARYCRPSRWYVTYRLHFFIMRAYPSQMGYMEEGTGHAVGVYSLLYPIRSLAITNGHKLLSRMSDHCWNSYLLCLAETGTNICEVYPRQLLEH